MYPIKIILYIYWRVLIDILQLLVLIRYQLFIPLTIFLVFINE